MSKYTTEVRYICETAAGYLESQGASKIDEIVNKTADELLGSYPIFDEAYRHALNVKIIKHYYLREIGQETAALWKFFLQRKMQEIMPYYNQLYLSELLEFNPLYDVDLTTEHKGDGAGQTLSDGTGSATETTSGKLTGTTHETTEDKSDSTAMGEQREVTGEKTGSTAMGESREISGETSSQTASGENRQVTGENTQTESTGESRSADQSSHNNVHWDLFQNTPQGGLTGVESQDYLTDARKITDTETNSASAAGNTSETTSGTRTADSTTSSSDFTSGTRESDRTGSTLDQESGTRDIDRTSNSLDQAESERNIDVNGTRNETTSGTRTSSNDSKTRSEYTNIDQYIDHVFGKRGGITYSSMLNEFRSTFLNIDMMIIEELEDCFFQLW